jgi:hypothetical protein
MLRMLRGGVDVAAYQCAVYRVACWIRWPPHVVHAAEAWIRASCSLAGASRLHMGSSFRRLAGLQLLDESLKDQQRARLEIDPWLGPSLGQWGVV